MKIFGKEVKPATALIGAAALVYVLFEGGKLAVSAVNAKYLDFQTKDFSFSSTGGSISLAIINGSPSSYTLQSLIVDISDNGTRIATATYMGQLIIMPNATTILTLNITLDPAGLIATALEEGTQLIKGNGTDSQTFTAKGSAQVDTIMIPVNTTISVIPAT